MLDIVWQDQTSLLILIFACGVVAFIVRKGSLLRPCLRGGAIGDIHSEDHMATISNRGTFPIADAVAPFGLERQFCAGSLIKRKHFQGTRCRDVGYACLG